MGVATPIHLTDDERDTLTTLVRSATAEQRLVQRARIALEAAAGKPTKEVAALLHVRPATVSKWRTRFAQHRVAGLADAPRTGKPRVYDETTERRIVAQLDQPPPDGYTTWTGGLVAKALGGASSVASAGFPCSDGAAREHRPPVQQKAADIVLYLDPPEHAVVVMWTRSPPSRLWSAPTAVPNGKAVRGHDAGPRPSLLPWKCIPGPCRGPLPSRRRREFLDFMNRVIAQHPETELHVILDNLNTHKPKHDRWLARNTPTHALNGRCGSASARAA